MNSTFIRLWDVLKFMDSLDGQERPVKFQMKYVTANRLQGTGGEIIELKDACKCSGKTKEGKPLFSAKKINSSNNSPSKDPQHWPHSTRNLLLPNGQIRKAHIRLIIEFNNQKVCY
jgi:hypothetical protein